MTVKRYGELKKLLGNQDCFKVPEEIYQYAKAQRTLFNVVCDVFNYGYILGIRAEKIDDIIRMMQEIQRIRAAKAEKKGSAVK